MPVLKFAIFAMLFTSLESEFHLSAILLSLWRSMLKFLRVVPASEMSIYSLQWKVIYFVRLCQCKFLCDGGKTGIVVFDGKMTDGKR